MASTLGGIYNHISYLIVATMCYVCATILYIYENKVTCFVTTLKIII